MVGKQSKMVAGFCTAYTGRFYNRISLAVYMGNLSFILQIYNCTGRNLCRTCQLFQTASG